MSDVAIKLHHIQEGHADFMKENYVKHAIREVDTHKNICHPNIVKVHDIVSIDQDTFVTVMEFCQGQVFISS